MDKWHKGIALITMKGVRLRVRDERATGYRLKVRDRGGGGGKGHKQPI